MTGRALASVSFRDPAGFIYEENGRIYRQINLPARDHYDLLMDSGLYRELTEQRLLIPHDELRHPPYLSDNAYKVIQPELVRWISYPFEWSFSQYQDAALLTLNVQRRALEHGMSLKDSSAFNVQFHEGHPVFIDTLSFAQYQEGQPWVAYRQFCQHFLAPLAVMSMTDIRLGQLGRTNLDGVPLDLATRLLPWHSRVRPGLLLHLHLHGSIREETKSSVPRTGRFSRSAMLGLIDSLQSAVKSLSWKPGRSAWTDYTRESTYTAEQSEQKGQFVEHALDHIRPSSVWDLGANTGFFSRLSSVRGIPTAAFDLDPGCVETNYLEVKRKQETWLLPLVLDLLNPSPGCGWLNQERASIFHRGRPEMVFALALIHHLAVVGNLPLENIAEFFGGLAPWLLIEFVTPDDPQFQSLAARRKGIHHPYDQVRFETCFSRYFLIRKSQPIMEGKRLLYLMQRHGDHSSNDG